MPNDAKLGLAVGVGLVIVVAAVFSRKDLGAGPVHAAGVVTSPIAPAPLPPPAPTQGVADRSHTVEEGDTLTSLALQFYGDRSKAVHLFRANRDRLQAPDRLPVG